MKIALSGSSLYHLFSQGELTLTSFLKYAASLGVDGVELSDLHLQGDCTKLEELIDALGETKLKVAYYNLDDRYPDAASLQAAITTGLKLKCTCFGLKQAPSGELIPKLTSVIELLQGQRATLCLENTAAENGSSAAISDFLEELNNSQVKSTFNMANFFLVGESPALAFQQLTPYIGHVRASDLRTASAAEKPCALIGADGQSYVGSVVGLGVADVPQIVDLLRKKAYKQWITLDFTGLEKPRFGIEASLLNLRQCLRTINIH